MIETQKLAGNGVLRKSSLSVYKQDEINGLSADKKDEIVQLITEGSQLTLLATIIEEIGTELGLDTPAFNEGKVLFDQIRTILNK